ncbi:unnamed protein product, partial [Mesorhabditis belari]|uniref:Uncharacterized protein n=1 Tax=Mesorhabditis belari TaxID=2138241 RepID=A0AAF3F341_9BILA
MNPSNQENFYFYQQPSTSGIPQFPVQYVGSPQVGGFHHRPISRPNISDPANRLREKQQQQISSMAQQRVGDWMGGHHYSPMSRFRSGAASIRSCNSAVSITSGVSNASTVMTQLSVITDLDVRCLQIVEPTQEASNRPDPSFMQNLAVDMQRWVETIFELAKQGQHDKIPELMPEISKRAEHAQQIPAHVINTCIDLLQRLVISDEARPITLFHTLTAMLFILNRRPDAVIKYAQQLAKALCKKLEPNAVGLKEYVGKAVCLITTLVRLPGANGEFYQKQFRDPLMIDHLSSIIFTLDLDTERRRIAIWLYYEFIRDPRLRDYSYQKGALQCFLQILEKESQQIAGQTMNDDNTRPQSPVEEPVLFYTCQFCAKLLSHGSGRLLQKLLKLMAEILKKVKLLPLNKTDYDVILPAVVKLLGSEDLLVIKETTTIISKLLHYPQARLLLIQHGSATFNGIDEIFSVLRSIPNNAAMSPYQMLPNINFSETVEEIQRNCLLCFHELLKISDDQNKVFTEQIAIETVKQICDSERSSENLTLLFSQIRTRPITQRVLLIILCKLCQHRRTNFLEHLGKIIQNAQGNSNGQTLPIYFCHFFWEHTLAFKKMETSNDKNVRILSELIVYLCDLLYACTIVPSFAQDIHHFFVANQPGDVIQGIRSLCVVDRWLSLVEVLSRNPICLQWIGEAKLQNYLNIVASKRLPQMMGFTRVPPEGMEGFQRLECLVEAILTNLTRQT